MNTTATPVAPYLPCPPLAHDAMMLERSGTRVRANGRIERAVAFNLLRHLAASGWDVVRVDDGDEQTTVTKESDPALAAMNLIFNLDIGWVHFAQAKGAFHAVSLVLGNDGTDLVADWSYAKDDADGFNACMEAFDAEAVVAALLGGPA